MKKFPIQPDKLKGGCHLFYWLLLNLGCSQTTLEIILFAPRVSAEIVMVSSANYTYSRAGCLRLTVVQLTTISNSFLHILVFPLSISSFPVPALISTSLHVTMQDWKPLT